MESSFVFYVKVGTFTHHEQSKNALLTVNKMEIVRLTVYHDSIASIRFIQYPGDSVSQSSPDVLSLIQ